MPAPPEDDELRDIAIHQYAYEVRTLLEQVTALAVDYGHSHAPDPVFLALVEAPLVHLRLLDDFFGRQRPDPDESDDVVAMHYVEAWPASHFLTWKVRDGINAQLQHLVRRRKVGVKWSLGELCLSMARTHQAFVSVLADHRPDRIEWFEEPSYWCSLILESPGWVPEDGLYGS